MARPGRAFCHMLRAGKLTPLVTCESSCVEHIPRRILANRHEHDFGALFFRPRFCPHCFGSVEESNALALQWEKHGKSNIRGSGDSITQEFPNFFTLKNGEFPHFFASKDHLFFCCSQARAWVALPGSDELPSSLVHG